MTQEIKYTRGKIYKITDNAYSKCYIGSTTQPLSARMAGHRRSFHEYSITKTGFMTSFLLFEEFGVEHCKIELIENCPCDSMEQLKKKEGEYIMNTECVNKCIAGRTRQEYKKAYYEANKEKVLDKNKQYNTLNREKLQQYNLEYRHKNPESMRQNYAKYRQKNADQIAENGSQRMECCICSLDVRRDSLRKHQRSKRCQRANEEKTNTN